MRLVKGNTIYEVRKVEKKENGVLHFYEYGSNASRTVGDKNGKIFKDLAEKGYAIVPDSSVIW